MKLNNKGTTIIELVVSIALLGVVMVFMYQMLSNVKFERDNEYFASKNQETRIDIIDAIEDVIEEKIYSASNYKFKIFGEKFIITTTPETTLLEVIDTDTEKKIIVNDKEFPLADQVTDIGDMEMNCINARNKVVTSTSSSGNTICEVRIPIYTDNDNNKSGNNNTLDDIVFSFIQGSN